MLNASVGFQRVLGRVRRPHGPPRPTRPARPGASAIAPRVRHGVHSVVAASRLAPIRDHPCVGARPVETPVGHERASCGRSLPDLPARARPRGRRRGRGDPRRRIGRQRLGRASGGATGGTNGDGPAPRIAVGGGTADTVRPTRRRTETGDALGILGPSDRQRRVRPAGQSTSRVPFAAIDFGDPEIGRTEPTRCRGSVHRRRHADQADRGRHDRPRRQRPGRRPTRSRRATRSPTIADQVQGLDDERRLGQRPQVQG